MRTSLDEQLDQKLDERRQQGLLRQLTNRALPIDFFSNDYLGLARSEVLFRSIEALHRQADPRNGSTGSRLLGGNSDLTQNVEKKLANIFRSETSLLFNSGYAANLAVLSSIPAKGDTILFDNLAHASLKDGARLSLAHRHSFRHNDPADLERKMKSAKGRIYVVVESVYSMDGDECPLNAVVELAGKFDAVIILDEAHSTGVRGPLGSGLAVEQELYNRIPIRIYTFGKGMGVHGACVAASAAVIRFLINFARPFIYTTALAPHAVAAIDCAFTYLRDHIELQDILKKKVNLYRANAFSIGRSTPGTSAIQTVIVPGNENVKRLAAALQQRGLDVRPILSPTVPEGAERLRICLHTYNSDEEILALTSALQDLT